MTLDVAWALRWTRTTAEMIAQSKDELTELDRQIGDGDHGENLNRGYQAVVAKLDSLTEPPAQIGDVLKLVATTLMSSVGGASGPLYGTAYLRAAKVTGLAQLDSQGVVALLEAALEGITARGKATPGEKTMVDAWQPAVDAAVAAAGNGASTTEVLAGGSWRRGTGHRRTPSRCSRPRAGPATSASGASVIRTRARPPRSCSCVRQWPPSSLQGRSHVCRPAGGARRARPDRARPRVALPAARGGSGGARGARWRRGSSCSPPAAPTTAGSARATTASRRRSPRR